jgi:hypothetical protein
LSIQYKEHPHMNITLAEQLQVESAAHSDRFDLYTAIHKALRHWMSHVLVDLGQIDTRDESACARTLGDLDGVLDALTAHLNVENQFIHTAIDARDAGTSARIAGEHQAHEAAMARLRQLGKAVADAEATGRDRLALALYRAFALFMAENLEHMQFEETEHHRALWASYSDAELLGIHQSILAAIPREKMAAVLHWMIPAITPANRAAMLADMRAAMPPAAFGAILELARSRLGLADWTKLSMALGVPQVPGLVNLSRH